MNKIIFTGGGTAGHVTKNVAIIDALKEKNPEIQIQYIGSGSDYETEPMKKRGIEYKKISTGKLRRYFSITNALDFFRFFRGIEQSRKLLKKIKPKLIFSSGGYVALPVCIAASIQKIPIITHESDSVPGLANKLIAKVAKRVCTTFKKTAEFLPHEKIVLTGNPVRKKVLEGKKDSGLSMLKFTSTKKTILVMGGSQGAQKINELMQKILPELTRKYQTVHITGKDKNVQFEDRSYRQFPFVETEKLADIYATSDIIVSRAGANSIAEIMALKKPNILIPLPTSASNHQFFNAEEMEKKGCSILLLEPELTPNKLLNTIEDLLKNNQKQNSMIQNMSKENHNKATQKILNTIKQYI